MLRHALPVAALLLAVPAQAQWAAYPGGTRDTASETKAADVSKAAGMAGAAPMVLTTPDSFEKVLDFYRNRGKEIRLPPPPGQTPVGYERELPGGFRRGPNGMEIVPSGIKVKQVIFILDGAADLGTSKDWVSITRPFVGDMVRDGGLFTYKDVRDMTAILRSQKP